MSRLWTLKWYWAHPPAAAGLGRCLVLGPEQELQFRELDIRDSSLAASQDLGHDASVNNRMFLEDSVIVIDR